jgi:hypothetical protein
MKLSYLASQTADFLGTNLFKSWGRVVNSLEKLHYNNYEIRAIAQNEYLLIDSVNGIKGRAPYTALGIYLSRNGFPPSGEKMNKMVMQAFGERDGLELNENGEVCHRGTMPGNYHPDRTILVPIGTPSSCDPTTEQYWSA